MALWIPLRSRRERPRKQGKVWEQGVGFKRAEFKHGVFRSFPLLQIRRLCSVEHGTFSPHLKKTTSEHLNNGVPFEFRSIRQYHSSGRSMGAVDRGWTASCWARSDLVELGRDFAHQLFCVGDLAGLTQLRPFGVFKLELMFGF